MLFYEAITYEAPRWMVSDSEANVCVLRVKVCYFLIRKFLRTIPVIKFCAGKSFSSFPKTKEKGGCLYYEVYYCHPFSVPRDYAE